MRNLKITSLIAFLLVLFVFSANAQNNNCNTTVTESYKGPYVTKTFKHGLNENSNAYKQRMGLTNSNIQINYYSNKNTKTNPKAPTVNVTQTCASDYLSYDLEIEVTNLGGYPNVDITDGTTTHHDDVGLGTYTISGLTSGITVHVFNDGIPGDEYTEAIAMCDVCTNPDLPADECADAPMIDLSQPFAGSTSCAYTESTGSEAAASCGTVENDSWITFQAAASDVELEFEVGTCSGSNTGVQLVVFSGSCGVNCSGLTEIAGSCENPVSDPNAEETNTWSFSGLTPGDVYYVRIDGYAGQLCDYWFTPISGVVIIPPNDDCATADTITCAMSNNVISNLQASNSDVGSLPACGGATYEDGVWYYFAGTGQDITLSTDNAGTNFDTEISVFSGDCIGGFTCIGTDADSGTGETSEITFTAASGTDYYIYLDGESGAEGQFELSVSCAGAATNDITGTLTYANTGSDALQSQTVNLHSQTAFPNAATATTTTNASGQYTFANVADGDYYVIPSTSLAWKGVTAMDITHYLKHIAASPALTGLELSSGDANGITSVTTADLTLMKQRIVTMISDFPRPQNFVYTDSSVTVSGSSQSLNIQALAIGDANASYPGPYAKSVLTNIPVINEGVVIAQNDEYFEIPVKLAETHEDLASITLEMEYNSDAFQIDEIEMVENNSDIFYNITDDKIYVVYSTLNAITAKSGEVLFNIKGYVVNNEQATNITTKNNGEFGNFDDQVINDVQFVMPMISPTETTVVSELDKSIAIYPNPAKNVINITNTKGATIELYDIFGKKLNDYTSTTSTMQISTRDLENGTYFIQIFKDGQLVTKKVTVVK